MFPSYRKALDAAEGKFGFTMEPYWKIRENPGFPC